MAKKSAHVRTILSVNEHDVIAALVDVTQQSEERVERFPWLLAEIPSPLRPRA